MTSVVFGITVVIKRNLAWKCVDMFTMCIISIFSDFHLHTSLN